MLRDADVGTELAFWRFPTRALGEPWMPDVLHARDNKLSRGDNPKNSRYDPVLLLQEAQNLREKARSADMVMRAVYRSRAAECEVRASLSLHTPVIKENVARWGDLVEDHSEREVRSQHQDARCAMVSE